MFVLILTIDLTMDDLGDSSQWSSSTEWWHDGAMARMAELAGARLARCYRHNLAEPEGGHANKMDLKDKYD
jgi:hypothetical protein